MQGARKRARPCPSYRPMYRPLFQLARWLTAELACVEQQHEAAMAAAAAPEADSGTGPSFETAAGHASASGASLVGTGAHSARGRPANVYVHPSSGSHAPNRSPPMRGAPEAEARTRGGPGAGAGAGPGPGPGPSSSAWFRSHASSSHASAFANAGLPEPVPSVFLMSALMRAGEAEPFRVGRPGRQRHLLARHALCKASPAIDY